MTKLLLASTSRYRIEQLKNFGLEFKSTAPLIDEDALKTDRLSPRALSRFLARKKAESLRAQYPRHAILGADQLVSFQGRVLGKPHSIKNARAMLKAMSGRTHQLITSQCLFFGESFWQETVTANITLRNLSTQEIAVYVERDQPLDCAGSYKFEMSGLSLVKKLRVSDPSSLTGLSLMAVMKLLLKTGEPLPFRKK